MQEKMNSKGLKKRDAHQASLQKLSENTLQLIKKDGCFEMSIYNDELTTKNIIKGTGKLKKSFPALTKEFFDVFADRIKDNKFTDNRLNDSINHVIDNCIYPTPSIAQFISFDKRIKLYTYHDIVKMQDQTQHAFKSYRPVKINGVNKPMYASINDIVQYNLEKWDPKIHKVPQEKKEKKYRDSNEFDLLGHINEKKGESNRIKRQ
jgi:hypothetical protein